MRFYCNNIFKTFSTAFNNASGKSHAACWPKFITDLLRDRKDIPEKYRQELQSIATDLLRGRKDNELADNNTSRADEPIDENTLNFLEETLRHNLKPPPFKGKGSIAG